MRASRGTEQVPPYIAGALALGGRLTEWLSLRSHPMAKSESPGHGVTILTISILMRGECSVLLFYPMQLSKESSQRS
jgi:hypothetical protein